jgi:hypothetical protein
MRAESDSSSQDDDLGVEAAGSPIVYVRRDTANGLPYGSVHSAGIGAIVAGTMAPNSTVTVTLSHSGIPLALRTVLTDSSGGFSVSVDRLIEDGDTVDVTDGAAMRTVQVPTMTVDADGVDKVVSGVGPASISSTSGPASGADRFAP